MCFVLKWGRNKSCEALRGGNWCTQHENKFIFHITIFFIEKHSKFLLWKNSTENEGSHCTLHAPNCAHMSHSPRSKTVSIFFRVHLRKSSDKRDIFGMMTFLMSLLILSQLTLSRSIGKCHMLLVVIHHIGMLQCIRGREHQILRPLSAFTVVCLSTENLIENAVKWKKFQDIENCWSKKRELYCVYTAWLITWSSNGANTNIRARGCMGRSIHVPRLTYVMFSFFFFASRSLFCALFYLLLLF